MSTASLWMIFVCEGNSYITVGAHVLKIRKSLLWRVWGTKKLLQDISVSKYLSIYPYLLLFKSITVEKCSWKIEYLENICLLFHMLFFPAKSLKNICRFFYSNWTSTFCNFTKSWSTSQARF